MKHVFNISFPVLVLGGMLFAITDEKPWGIPFIGVTAIIGLLFMYNLLSLRASPLIGHQRFAASFAFAAVVALMFLLAGKQLEAAAYGMYSLLLAGTMIVLLYRAPRDSGFDRIMSLLTGIIIVVMGTLIAPQYLWIAITIAGLVSVLVYWAEQVYAQRRIETDQW